MKKKSNLKSLDEFIEEQYGKRGTNKREKFEKEFEAFKLGVLIQQARLEKGMTHKRNLPKSVVQTKAISLR